MANKNPRGNPYWPKGVSGNPKGRPKGLRNTLSEDFLGALSKDFAEHGMAAVEKVREDEPSKYLSIIAQVLPKEVVVTLPILEQIEGMSDAELDAEIGRLLGETITSGLALGAGTTEEREPH